MNILLILLILIPGFGFIISLILPERSEKLISGAAFVTTGAQVLLVTFFIILWMNAGAEPIHIKELTLYHSGHYSFFIELYFDHISAVYLLFASILSYLIAVYSRYYMHRERGYKRFFNTKLLFVTAIQIIILSGNFETLFIGWEILGISSFLLIAFYRDRYLPVRNALKVYSIYRVADSGILLAMWLSHHLWHQNVTFAQLNDQGLVANQVDQHNALGILISLALVLTAAAKSAQFPFSTWLPRAMEGPTPSSAIFYGSVAVHIGGFLLLRTFHFWEGQTPVRITVFALGAITAITSALTARVQTSVKAQIAYSSITQIGLIFIEISLGLEWVALIHMCGNAFLRAYQLLISPSIVTYLIREQFFTLKPEAPKKRRPWKRIIDHSVLVMGIREWELESILKSSLWLPLKKIGKWMGLIPVRLIIIFSTLIFSVSSFIIADNIVLPKVISLAIPEIFGAVGLLLVLRSFAERGSPFRALSMVILSHCWIALAVGFNETFNLEDTVFYLGGVVIAGIFGYFFLHRLRRQENFDLNNFYGHSREHKWMAFGFLISCLALSGFPITTTFIGEDLLFTHIHEDQVILASFVSITFIIEGIALIRIYARIFLGPCQKNSFLISKRNA